MARNKTVSHLGEIMPRSTSASGEHNRDWFDEQLDAFKWRNQQRAMPDYELNYDTVLGEEVTNARQRYLDTMAEHQRRRAEGL